MPNRNFVSPGTGDDLDSIAARVLPDAADAAEQLLSWNLHIAARGGSFGLLPSDIVFIEPPPAA